jgi:hypothetical protein
VSSSRVRAGFIIALISVHFGDQNSHRLKFKIRLLAEVYLIPVSAEQRKS